MAETGGSLWVRALRSALAEPRLEGIEPDGPGRIRAHREILASKAVMREVFTEIYERCVSFDRELFSGQGVTLEIGAGVSLFQRFHPEVLSTDVEFDPAVRVVMDALAFPFAAGRVRAVYGVNCFHHFPDPVRFLEELQRVLVPGGGCVLVEPYYGVFARAFYRRAFIQERFDMEQAEWNSPRSGMTNMRGANQALSWIVFVRDEARLAAAFPGLELVRRETLRSYLRYFLSGGLNFRSLVPGSAAPAIRLLERLLKPAERHLALHHLVVLRKRE